MPNHTKPRLSRKIACTHLCERPFAVVMCRKRGWSLRGADTGSRTGAVAASATTPDARTTHSAAIAQPEGPYAAYSSGPPAGIDASGEVRRAAWKALWQRAATSLTLPREP